MDTLIETQLAHNEWAIRTLLRCSAPLADDQWRRPFAVGPGSLERTLAHLIDVMDYFADAFAHREYVERADFEEGAHTPEALLAHLERAAAELRSAARSVVARAGTDTKVELPIDSGRWMTAAVALAQIFDHGTHHRAQCGWMLREVGVHRTPETHPLLFAGVDDGDE